MKQKSLRKEHFDPNIITIYETKTFLNRKMTEAKMELSRCEIGQKDQILDEVMECVGSKMFINSLIS